MVSTDRYSGRIKGGAQSRRENGRRGVRGKRRDKILRVRGWKGGHGRPDSRKGVEREPEDDPTCTAPRGVEAPPSAWQRRRAIACGFRARPARDQQRHPLAAPRGRVCTEAQFIVRTLVPTLVFPAPSCVRPGDTHSCTHSRISFEKNNIFLDTPPNLCKLARGRGYGRDLLLITGAGRGRPQPLVGWRSDVTHMTP